MAQRKKRAVKPPSKRKRSKAAKKGWETRRARAEEARHKQLVSRIDKKYPQLKESEADFKIAVASAVARTVKKELAEIEKLYVMRINKRIVKEQIRKGLINDTPEEIILARLKNADMMGEYYDVVLELGDEFPEYSLHEIYTMGMSPS